MEGYDASTYGDRIADVYDGLYGVMDPEPAVDFLAELAGDGPALELAIGTGRVALPLAARGVEVHGIDVSEAMVAKLREKPGGDAIAVTMGDFADVPVEGRYRLVYLVFNTLFGLTTQEEQLRCLENVAERLEGGGAFVVEVFFPDVARFDRDQRVSAVEVGVDRVIVNADRHDPVRQTVDSVHVVATERGIRLYPVSLRYAWPPELDLMARIAGMRLRDRFADWDRSPFGPGAGKHVSVYERV